MLINQTFEIDSCDDVELNIKRTSKLEYRISYDDEKEMKAIVFIIGGYGANANIHFLDSYRNYIAKKFDVATINVFLSLFLSKTLGCGEIFNASRFYKRRFKTYGKSTL